MSSSPASGEGESARREVLPKASIEGTSRPGREAAWWSTPGDALSSSAGQRFPPLSHDNFLSSSLWSVVATGQYNLTRFMIAAAWLARKVTCNNTPCSLGHACLSARIHQGTLAFKHNFCVLYMDGDKFT